MARHPAHEYEWTRFVHEPSQTPMLDDGFLFDPESSSYLDTPCAPLVRVLNERGCVVLLGQPGMGKTTALHAAWERALTHGERAVLIRAAEVADVGRALREHRVMHEWRQAQGPSLRVFVDSIDESPKRSTNPVRELVEELVATLETLPLQRLSVVIACRSGRWNPAAEATVKRLATAMDAARATHGLPSHEVPSLHVCELAPVRRRDVQQAGQIRGMAAEQLEQFMEAVRVHGLGFLASRPLTLELLLRLYATRGALPGSAAELFLAGCRLFCDSESTGHGRRLAVTRTLDVEARLAVAMRIAAVTQLGGRRRIVVDAAVAKAADAVAVAEIAGQPPAEEAHGQRFDVEAHMVIEALTCALFDGDGLEFRWIHEELADFLASRYLLRHGLPAHQVLGLLGYGQQQAALIPQLAGVARWIDGTFPEDIRKQVVELDPTAALQGDVASRSDADKELIVAAVLDGFASGRLLEPHAFVHAYDQLAHAGLEAQLRPLLRDGNAGLEARAAAVLLGGTCKLSGLMDELVRISTDVSTQYGLRVTAAWMVRESGDREAQGKLRPLLDGLPAQDPDNELYGIALESLWGAGYLHIDEVFDYLRQPQRGHVVSYYDVFVHKLADRIQEQLDLDGLRKALAWARDNGWDESLAEAIHALALERLDEADIAAAVALVLLDKAAANEHIRRFCERTDGPQRRVLLGHILDEISHSQLFWLCHEGFLSNQDFSWLLEWMTEEPNHERQQRLGELIRQSILDYQSPSQYMELVERYHGDPQRYHAFRPLVLRDIDSEESRSLRDSYYENRRFSEEMAACSKERRDSHPRYEAADVAKAIDAVEQGDTKEWIWLALALWLEARASAREAFWGRTIDTSPGWEQASSTERHRIQSAAERYLQESDPETDRWIGTNSLYYSAGAGLHALALLAAYAPDRLAALDASTLARWAPAVAAQPLPQLKSDIRERLIQAVRPHGHQTLPVALRKAADGKSMDSTRWDALWVPEMAEMIIAELQGATLPTRNLVVLASLLLTHVPEQARSVVEPLLAYSTEEPEAQELLATLTSHALHSDTRHYWPLLWQRIKNESALGRAAIARATGWMRTAPTWIGSLTADELADLYQWLHTEIRRENIHQIGVVTEDMQLDNLSHDVLRTLADRGSWDTVAAVRRLQAQYAGSKDFRRLLAQAEYNARRATWQPPSPGLILALAADSRRWWILHSNQLQQAITHALSDLHIDRRRAWERVAGDAHQPVSEAALAAVIRDELTRQLAAITVGAKIHVDRVNERLLQAHAGQNPGGAPIRVDIALIPSWAEDPAQAMDTLAKRMTEESSQYGVALIAAFGGQAWTRRADHERRRRARLRDLADTRHKLRAHAADIEAKDERSIDVCVAKLQYDESVSELEHHLLWGHELLASLAAHDIEPIGVRSISDDEHWQLFVRWPDTLAQRFSLAPHGLILACHGAMSPRDIQLGRDMQGLADARRDESLELDPELLVVVDDAPALEARMERMAGAGQRIPWPAPAFPPPATQLSGSLHTTDIFSRIAPVRGRQFVGRHDEVAELERMVLRGESAGIYGLRKSGKTSLARAITDRLDPVSMALSLPGVESGVDVEPQVWVIWLDMESAMTGRTEEGLWNAVLQATRRRLRAAGQAAEPGGGNNVFAELESALRAALAAGCGRLCLVLDEYDLLFEGPDSEPAIPVVRLLRLLRGLAQETGGVSLVVIGRDANFLASPQIEGVSNPMLAWFHQHPIEMLAPEDADDLLVHLGKRVGLDMGRKTLEQAYEWSTGHARLLRAFGSAVFAAARRRDSSADMIAADELDLDAVLERYLESELLGRVQEETFQLLEVRYPAAYRLVEALVSTPPHEQRRVLEQHGGWMGRAAHTLRKFRLLLGTARAPELPRWVRWYAEEILQLSANMPEERVG